MIVVLVLGLVLMAVSQSQGELTTAQQDYNELTLANMMKKEARGPGQIEYDVQLLVSINGTLSVSTLNFSNPYNWDHTQRLGNATVLKSLFDLANPSVRQDPNVRSTYQCTPNETVCHTITVRPMRLQSIGSYSYQSRINSLDRLFVDYRVATWAYPLDLQCQQQPQQTQPQQTQPQQPLSDNNQNSCAVNKTLGVVSVLGSNRVTITCSIFIVQNDIYDPQVDVVIRSVEDNAECSDTDTTQVHPLTYLLL